MLSLADFSGNDNLQQFKQILVMLWNDIQTRLPNRLDNKNRVIGNATQKSTIYVS